MLDDVSSMHFAAFGIGGPDDVVPRPPEHVRCKNFGCNKPRAQTLGKSIRQNLVVQSCIFPISVYFPHLSDIPTLFECCIGSPDEHQIPQHQLLFPVLAQCIAKVLWSKIPRANEAYDSDWDRFQAHHGVMVQSVANCSDFVVSQVCSPQITTCISRDGKVLGVLSWQKGLGLVQYRNLSWHVVHVKFTFLFCIGLLWRDSELLWTWCW